MNKLAVVITALINFICIAGIAQPIYITRSGQVSFFSKAPLERIEAVNNEVSSILNTETGEIVFAVLIKGFRFEKALMEEHFNENYLESDKLPKSTFQGKITNLANIDFQKEGNFPAIVEGDLTIHGVKQRITSSGTITVAGGKITINAAFKVRLADFEVERPALVGDKIAEIVDVSLRCHYDPRS